MSRQFALSLLFLATCVAVGAAPQSGLPEATKARAAVALVKPRLLWPRREESKAQTPIIIYSNPESGNERYHSHNYPAPNYYPYPYPVPQTPLTPPFNFPGIPNDIFRQGTPSIVIINPNNQQSTQPQNSTGRAATAAAATPATGRRTSIPLLDLLTQGSAVYDDVAEAINTPESPEEPEVPSLVVYGGDERDEDVVEDELALLDRQPERGLTAKNLLSFLEQDKRRKRIQEAVVGFYLRHYNVNRK